MARLNQLALFYRSLGQLLESGVPLLRALESLSRPRLSPAHGLARAIQHGATLAEALAGNPNWFPSDHVKLLAIAERSGRLDQAFSDLANHVTDLLELRRMIQSGLVLPLLVFHAAAFIIPLPALLLSQDNGMTGYLAASAGLVAMFWLVIAGGGIALKLMPSRLLDASLRPIPLVGRTWRELDYARIARQVEMLTSAGLDVITALRFAGSTCHSPRLAAAMDRAADQAEHTTASVSEALAAQGVFPEDFIALWSTGEQSGRLDRVLRDLADRYASRCRDRMREIGRWLPRIVYGLVMIYLAIQILRGALNYIDLINSI